MKRVVGLGLLLASLSLPVLAAKNSHVFSLPWDVRVGDVQLPHGRWEVSWTEPAGSQVQLTITTEHKKSITVPATVTPGKQTYVGALTSEVKGVRYLTGFQTKDAVFMVEAAATDRK